MYAISGYSHISNADIAWTHNVQGSKFVLFYESWFFCVIIWKILQQNMDIHVIARWGQNEIAMDNALNSVISNHATIFFSEIS